MEQGESIVTIHSNREDVSDVIERIYHSYDISQDPVAPNPLIYSEMTH